MVAGSAWPCRCLPRWGEANAHAQDLPEVGGIGHRIRRSSRRRTRKWPPSRRAARPAIDAVMRLDASQSLVNEAKGLRHAWAKPRF